MPSWYIGGIKNAGKMQQMLAKWSPLMKEMLLIILKIIVKLSSL
jgi:hypothetical protein